MGTVLLNMGQYSSTMIPMLEQAVPGEQFAAAGAVVDDAEVIATTNLHDTPIGPLLTPSVRWVHVLGAGIDGIALDGMGDRLLTCSRGASAVPISEFVLAEMLAFEKHIPDVWITEPPERWNMTATLGTLRHKTLGLVGVGAIGTEVARRALAFDMTVVAVRRRASEAPMPGITLVSSLTELLGRADHVVIAAPATAETYHLIDADALAACKPGVHMVNIARGSLVDQDALLDALDRGQVAAASLDVVDPEPLPAGHRLYDHPRVRLTPHVSWSSPDTIVRTVEMFVDNLRRYRAGEPLEGIVTGTY